MMMDSFWKWLYRYSKKKIREMDRSDCKCPNCKEWFSVISAEGYVSMGGSEEFGIRITCGKCNHTSYWNDCAPVLLLCDEKGNLV